VKTLAVWIFVFGLLFFGWLRTLAYLRYYQQEEYNNKRFTNWLSRVKAYDRRGTITCLLAAITSWLLPNTALVLLVAILAASTLVAIVTLIEEDPRRSGKLKLAMTQRATKIATVAFIIFALLAILPALLSCSSCYQTHPLTKAAIFSALLIQCVPLLLIVANKILWPAEKALQERYISEAKEILARVNPYTIGITGSYGKTGAKAALGELLSQTLGPTFWPKKSINTVLGITRTIRETMRPTHRYAVIEMGAYQVGSIKKLCDFTPPRAALVTAVGIMHLERFGSPENIYRAKSEIAQALPEDAILVCNGDSPNARRMANEHSRSTTILYGLDQGAGTLDCYASDISFDKSGTNFVIHWRGARYPARTRLLGRPALSNILGAYAMVCALGAKPDYAAACIANLEPVDNRLVLDSKPEISFLRDAYNSNPTGFRSAIEVLKDLPATQKVLMTPGMIELGDLQYQENRAAATAAASVADLCVIVGPTNREALLTGLKDANYPAEKTIVVDTREEAFRVIQARCLKGALVLIENDLSDLHEGKIRF
jgi:UDP-N-acetylmuramoyl-tripeptide--D-alanyl-D-alanine ligase